MSGIISCSFSLNLTVLKLVGLYPSQKYPTLHKAYAALLFVLLNTPPITLGPLHFVFAEDITAVNFNDCVLVGMIMYTFKLLPFLKNADKIKKCVEYFDDYVVVNASQELIVENCVAACRRNSLLFFSGCIAGYFGVVGQTLASGKIEKLPSNVWLPEIWKETRLTFNCMYFLLMAGTAYASVASATIDPLIGGLSHHASAQLRILARCLRFLDQNVNTNCDNEEFVSDKHDVYKKIKLCIQQYQHIVTFVNKYQECFSPVMFSQLMGSILVIGLCCFQLNIMKVDVNFFLTVLSLCLVFFQILFYCYYGTLLVEEVVKIVTQRHGFSSLELQNNSLLRATYMSKWYEYDEHSKKALIILMERLKRPLVVTAGKLLVISLETFIVILKRSYSLLAVLKSF